MVEISKEVRSLPLLLFKVGPTFFKNLHCPLKALFYLLCYLYLISASTFTLNVVVAGIEYGFRFFCEVEANVIREYVGTKIRSGPHFVTLVPYII